MQHLLRMGLLKTGHFLMATSARRVFHAFAFWVKTTSVFQPNVVEAVEKFRKLASQELDAQGLAEWIPCTVEGPPHHPKFD